MKEIPMKMLVAAVALASLLTSPAFAQYGGWQSPSRAYAEEVQPYAGFHGYNVFRRSTNSTFDVYDTRGRYVGSDPDPRIRSMLQHDPPNSN